jgi:mRNA interferase RelE/StbE
VEVRFRKSFEKDLGKLRDIELLTRIKAMIEEAESTKNLAGLSNLKKLKTKGDFYRIRVGDYRMGLTADQGIICFVRVLHRKEIYRYFP